VLHFSSLIKKPLFLLLFALFALTGATMHAKAQLIVVTYAGKTSGPVTWKEIKADSVLVVKQEGVTVVSFQMNHIEPMWGGTVLKSTSNKITPEMRKEFKRLHRDDLLFFTNIRAVNAVGDTLWADPIQFKIK
jgi:hypothetical protein